MTDFSDIDIDMDLAELLPDLETPKTQSDTGIDSSECLEMLNEALDVGISILDQDLNYAFMNQGMFDQLGVSAEQLNVGDNLTVCHELMMENGLLTPDIIERNQLSADEQALRDSARKFTGIMEFADGRTMELRRTKLDNGYTVSVSHDISDVVEKDKLLQDALYLGKSGYWIYDLKTKETTLSKTLKTFFSREDQEKIKSEGINAITRPNEKHLLPNAIKDAAKSDGKFMFTHHCTSRDGTEILARVHGEILYDPNGKPSEIRAFVKDITTEVKQARALEKAKDEALEASKAKSEFLANMSHEIRTPMNGILGMAELLENTELSEMQQEPVEVINKSALALLSIINDILDFSKIEAGAFELDPVQFDLKDVINDIASLMTQPANNKGLELIVNYRSDLPRHFVGDSGRIRQVITNLVNNAIKFTHEGHILIDVDVRAANEKSTIIKLSVTDTGIGIDESKLANVFDKFTQADGSTTRLYGGTGLGLTICRRIIEMMGGKIKAKSTLGRGSTFTFAIPLPRDKNKPEQHYDTSVLRGKRALIVDDIEINRNILTRHLKAWDMQVVSAEDGVEALTLLKVAKSSGAGYDIVISDYLMPGMNGEELAGIIHNSQSISTVPIVILSSCDQATSSNDLKEIGVEAHITKPVRERKLYSTLVKVLSEIANGARADEKPTGLKGVPKDVFNPDEIVKPAVKVAGQKIDVLVAEDFVLNQDVVRLMLAETRFNPVFADNGQIALNMYKAEPDRFPVVLMDISMPVMDGYMATELIAEFEQETGRSRTPVIALTGHALKHDREKCLDSGMDDYLTKPVKQNDLIEKLEKWTQSGSAGMRPLPTIQAVS